MRLRNESLVPYLFLVPAIALLIIFNLIPAILTLRQSLYAESAVRGAEQVFVGLKNVARIFNDPVFWKSLQVTLIFSLIVNPLQTVLALGLALVANKRAAGIKFFRSIYLLPVAVSINVTVVVWGLMVDPNAGLVNGILNQFRLLEQPFLSSPDQALWTIIMIISWKGVPYWALFFLAALQGIYMGVLEAAIIDGADRWQLLTRIILPIIRPIISSYWWPTPLSILHCLCPLVAHPGRTSAFDQCGHVRNLPARFHLWRPGCYCRHAHGDVCDCSGDHWAAIRALTHVRLVSTVWRR